MRKSMILAGAAGITGMAIGVMAQKRKSRKRQDSYRTMAEKNMAILLLFNQWLIQKNRGVRLSEYFHRYHYQSIAVYGMGFVGQRLVEELADTPVEIKYVIDKNADYVHSDLAVFTPKDRLPRVDAVLVTPIASYHEIRNLLQGKVDCPVISVEDLMYDIGGRGADGE